MIPTLFLAIPGSSSMAVMIAALAFVGVTVGPNMLATDLKLSFALGATVILANLLAIPFFFIVIPSIVRMSALRREAIVPIAIGLSVMAALITEPTLTTPIQIFVASILGIGLKLANWPRAPFILGFVIAELAEKSYFLTADIWGWSALSRPLTILLLVALIAWIAVSMWRRPPFRLSGPISANLVLSGGLIAVFATMFTLSLPLQRGSGVVPLTISALGIVLCSLIFVSATRSRKVVVDGEEMRFIGLTGLFIAATPIIGILPATFFYVAEVLRRTGMNLRHAVVTAALCCGFELLLLVTVFDVLIEREIIGRLAWAALGY
jgi:hypothetical protein